MPDEPKQPPLPFEQRALRHDGEEWPNDPLVRTREGRVCCESELTRTDVEAGGLVYLEDGEPDEDQGLELVEDLDEDGQPYPF